VEDLTDVTYEVDAGLATITISRPERLNSFRAHTVDELITCLKRAWSSADVGVVCLTGAGDKAFCTGGDQKQRNETGDYGPSRTGLFEIDVHHRRQIDAIIDHVGTGRIDVGCNLCGESLLDETEIQ